MCGPSCPKKALEDMKLSELPAPPGGLTVEVSVAKVKPSGWTTPNSALQSELGVPKIEF